MFRRQTMEVRVWSSGPHIHTSFPVFYLVADWLTELTEGG